ERTGAGSDCGAIISWPETSGERMTHMWGVLSLLLAGSAVAAGDPVWNEAVATVGRSHVHPRAAIVSTVRTDGAGGELVRSETRVRFRTLPDGRLDSEIVFRSENGRPLGPEEQERKNREDTRRREGSPFRIDELPLSPELQRFVNYRRTGTTRDRVVFQFEMERGGDAIAGTVAISPAGVPLEMEFSPVALPPLFRSLESTLRFSATGDGGCRLSSMSVKGSVGALWFRRDFNSEYRFVEDLPARGE
ncbi:MAG: hypothetical protein LC732_10600, partial [Acidobacteria bacterium]|nr:hypothetical protein [Acidobacteriota bacterium]